MRSISSLLILVFTFWLSACALFEERPGPTSTAGPHEQFFYATYEEVWRAANLVLQPYPLRVSNMDQGILETDSIRGTRVYMPVYKLEGAAASASYKLSVHVIKGSLEKKTATRATLNKEVSMQSDFFSDPKQLSSDGLEEKTLLYRMGREIQIERALAKAQKRQNQNQK